MPRRPVPPADRGPEMPPERGRDGTRNLSAELDRLRAQAAALQQLLTVTEQAALEQAQELERGLAERTRMLSLLSATLESTADGLLVVDLDGRIVSLNGRFVEMWGIPSDVLKTGDDAKALAFVLEKLTDPEGFISKVRDLYAQPLADSFDILEFKDGRVFERYSQPQRVGEECVGRVWSFRDVTAQRRIEAELEAARDRALEASRLKSSFLANMSHEIRTPMNAVIGMTSLLLDTDLNTSQRDYVETLRGAARVLLDVINDILDFSKIEAGKLRLEEMAFDPQVVVSEVADLLASRANDKSLRLTSAIEPEVPRSVVGDPGRLRQVLLNLAGNAVKFTDQGWVRIHVLADEATEDSVRLRFEVADTGIGIPPEGHARLFEPFYQVDASDARRFGGSGLGLAISKQLVELMGGELGFKSEPGAGSTFWFSAACGLPGEAAGQTAAWASLGAVKVLVVDDDATEGASLDRQLHAVQMRSTLVSDARAALWTLQRAAEGAEPFDLAVVKAQMPGMDGLRLAHAIKRDPSLARTRVLLVGAGPSLGAEEADRSAGVVGRLAEPVRSEELYDSLSRALQARWAGPPPAAPTADGAASPTEESGPKPRVLVVEDNPVNQKVAALMLERLGYNVDVAGDGFEAVTALDLIPYAAVIMDCQMPGMDGFDATAEIRRREAGRRHTVIIAMTASAMEEDRDRCLRAGMDDYIAKPVRPEKLAAALEHWVPAGRL